MTLLEAATGARGLRLLALLSTLALAACGSNEPPATRAAPPQPQVSAETLAMYGPVRDEGYLIPAVPAKYLTDDKARQEVDYWSDEDPGTIVVDPWAKRLYLVQPGNRALRYTVGVGEDGRGFSGTGTIAYKRDWPTWTPTPRMLREKPEINEPFADGMPGGLDNPLGARALYLYKNGKDTLYRIHGTPYPWSVGNAKSSGCIRLFQQDILDLDQRVDAGTRVVVLNRAESGKGTVPPGGELLVSTDPLATPGPNL